MVSHSGISCGTFRYASCFQSARSSRLLAALKVYGFIFLSESILAKLQRPANSKAKVCHPPICFLIAAFVECTK